MAESKGLTNIILNRAVGEIIVKSHLEKALRSGKKLRVKLGIDPTAPDLHLGHTVILRKLRQFQDAGHKAVLIIGDFTAQIGDPSGRSEERKPLSKEDIKKNLKNFLRQAGKVISVKRAEIHYNSKWLAKGLEHILDIARSATVQQVLRRQDFKKRLKGDVDITMLEMFYPILQGYDSVAIKADVELGGTDQKFNLLMGRRVQRHFNVLEQDILTVPLIEGVGGTHKMSKSYGNYIGIEEKPGAMFGKIMSVSDSLIKKYFEALTDIAAPKNLNIYESKLLLAETIVKMYHSAKDAKETKEEFLRVFSKKELPEKIQRLRVKNKKLVIVELLLQSGVGSKSEARRLITQGGIKINEDIKKDPKEILTLKSGDILKIGKRRFYKISA